MILTGKKGLAAYLAETGGGSLPDIAGCFPGRGLVIVADGACVWEDLEAFGCRSDEGRGSVAKDGFDFMAVNHVGALFPGELKHWFSNSPSHVHRFVAARRDEYSGEFSPPQHTHACQKGAMWCWPWSGAGTSLLGACLTGVALGYGPIVLCGAPLDDGPHNGEPPWRRTKFTTEVRGPDKNWQRAIDLVLRGKVTSMSGRTKDWLGCSI